MELAGKTILVTGGTDGIGAQLIRQLRDAGAQVITTGRNASRIAATRDAGFEVIGGDLATPAGADALLAALAGRDIDVLINNAGMGEGAHDYRLGPADAAKAAATIQLNFATPVALIAGLMPMLKSRPRAMPRAMIVNVTSGLAIAPRAGGPVYCATKAALRAYTQGLRVQLRGSGIAVVEALPPVVDTRMTAGRSNRKMPAADCARAIVRAMLRDQAEVRIGAVKVLHALHSISPRLARSIMLRY